MLWVRKEDVSTGIFFAFIERLLFYQVTILLLSRDKTISVSDIKIEVTVPVNAAHSWEYFFNQVNGWWPKEFFTSTKTRRFMFETYVGGKVYEDFGEGDGLVWAHVIGNDYLHSLEMKGFLTRRFGGPAITFEKFSFEENQEGSTNIIYTMDILGNVDKKTRSSLHEGWQKLLGEHFITYCKNRDR